MHFNFVHFPIRYELSPYLSDQLKTISSHISTQKLNSEKNITLILKGAMFIWYLSTIPLSPKRYSLRDPVYLLHRAQTVVRWRSSVVVTSRKKKVRPRQGLCWGVHKLVHETPLSKFQGHHTLFALVESSILR